MAGQDKPMTVVDAGIDPMPEPLTLEEHIPTPGAVGNALMAAVPYFATLQPLSNLSAMLDGIAPRFGDREAGG